MQSVKRFLHNRACLKRLLIAFIIIYPLAGAFLGLDLGDTGYHLYAYKNLVSHPDQVNYTTFFSSVIGYLWGLAFDGLGLIAYNLLEVFLEWGLAAIVYFTLKKDLGELTVLAGGLFSVICADTYLNIFNYHQCNVFLLTVILCLEYRAITRKRYWPTLWAGVFYVLVVFSRVGSVVALITCALYFYDAAMNGTPWKEVGKHALFFVAGVVGTGLVCVLALLLTGRMDFFISNIFRLGGIAADSNSGYSFESLLRSLIGDNLRVIASGFIFYAATAVLGCGFHIMLHKCATKVKKVFCVLIGLFVGVVAFYQMRFAFYVNPAENWPQMTTGQRFFIGVMYVTAFLCYLYHAFREDLHSRKLSLLVIASCMLVILTIAGSNTVTKHVILAMWLIAPVCFYTVRTLIFSQTTVKLAEGLLAKARLEMYPRALFCTAAVAVLMCMFKFGHMVYYTFNYDDVNRTHLTATVDNDKVRGILTTKREADALNGVLGTLEQYNEQTPLLVFGNSLLFYYMTGRPAYGVAWATQSSYPLEQFRTDLTEAGKENGGRLPLVVYCRTNYSLGFDEGTLEQNQKEVTLSGYSGKKEYFYNFLKKYNYGVAYLDDYYMVAVPKIAKSMKGLKNVVFGG